MKQVNDTRTTLLQVRGLERYMLPRVAEVGDGIGGLPMGRATVQYWISWSSSRRDRGGHGVLTRFLQRGWEGWVTSGVLQEYGWGAPIVRDRTPGGDSMDDCWHRDVAPSLGEGSRRALGAPRIYH